MLQFEWNFLKELINVQKHGVDFYTAKKAFLDPQRYILKDEGHSQFEDRYFCIGMVDHQILTVRFIYREKKIRIFGAGYWRKGKCLYEEENKKKSEGPQL